MDEEEQFEPIANLDDFVHPPFFEERKNKIEDPWHSRVLDVHRWSDHPEFLKVVDQLWDAHFKDLEQQGRAGPKPKRSFLHQLRVLILDLYVAWTEDPTLCLAVSMSQNDWITWSRYNALSISRKIITLIHWMADAGLIDVARGSYAGPFAPYNRTTRIRAAEPLQTLFRAARVTRDAIHQVKGHECIILKDDEGHGAKLVEYEDCDQTNRMRCALEAYNTLLADSFIDLPTLEEPWVTRRDDRGREVRVRIDRHHQFVRRIFSRGDWGLNGRFYGPWWQQIGKDHRAQIFINDTPTVEVDFKGLHVAILAAEKGVVIEGDPYALHEGLVPGVSAELQRTIIKQLVLTALNAKTEKAAFASFRDGFPKGHMAKSLTNEKLGSLLTAFVDRHPYLKDLLCADQGIRLMNIDGRISEFVLRYFTRRGIPVLSVHDSFIVPYTHAAQMKRVMRAASRKVVGQALAVEANGSGLDEVTAGREVVLDFEAWRETARGYRYLESLRRWEEDKGREVIPYRRND